jgi:hypothetical protein
MQECASSVRKKNSGGSCGDLVLMAGVPDARARESIWRNPKRSPSINGNAYEFEGSRYVQGSKTGVIAEFILSSETDSGPSNTPQDSLKKAHLTCDVSDPLENGTRNAGSRSETEIHTKTVPPTPETNDEVTFQYTFRSSALKELIGALKIRISC